MGTTPNNRTRRPAGCDDNSPLQPHKAEINTATGQFTNYSTRLPPAADVVMVAAAANLSAAIKAGDRRMPDNGGTAGNGIADTGVQGSDVLTNAAAHAGTMSNGYPTGNQQYMHIMADAAGDGDAFQIWAYSYAFGAWSQLQIPVANTAVNTHYVPALITVAAAATPVYHVIPIHGIDRVAFVSGDAADWNGVGGSVKIAFNSF